MRQTMRVSAMKKAMKTEGRVDGGRVRSGSQQPGRREVGAWRVLAPLLVLAIAASSQADAASCGDNAGDFGARVPCSCGDEVVTKTTLQATDPVVTSLCSGNGLVLGADASHLDCAGLAIESDGFGVEGTAGIVVRGRRAVIVQRCIVDGFFDGILLDATHSSKIRFNHARNSLNDGLSLLGSSSNNALISNVSAENGDDGLDIGGGVAGESFVENFFVENYLLSNAGDGASIDQSVGGFFVENVVWRNGDDGIDENPVDNLRNFFLRNSASENVDAGFTADGESGLLLDNSGRRNGGSGMRVGGIDSVVSSNRFDDNGVDGVCIALPANLDGGGNGGAGNGGVDLNLTGPC